MRRESQSERAAWTALVEGKSASKPVNRHFAAGRLKSGVLNKTEARYAEYLEGEKRAGAVLWYTFEGITLKLAEGLRFTPDFSVLRADGLMELVDVKGRTTRVAASGERKEVAFAMDDSRQKVKMAAAIFPFVFVVAFPSKSGEWVRKEI